MKTLEEKIAVMKAALEGKEIESHNYYVEENWIKVDEPQWNWGVMDYRIKQEEPKPEYVPFESAEEFLQAQREHCYNLISKRSKEECTVYVNALNIYFANEWDYSAQELLEYFIFKDGTPCGKLKQ